MLNWRIYILQQRSLYIFNNLGLKSFPVVYKYRRRTKQRITNKNDLEKEIPEETLCSLTSAALDYNIMYATLYGHVKNWS
jgi:hypothetical protein